MLKKYEALKAVENAGILAVVRGKSEENSYEISKASITGGVKAIELAFTSPNADTTIKRLSEEYQDDPSVVVGAGTVLDGATARMAMIAGAKFIVSPSYNEEVAKLCNLYAVPYMPGCFTPSEVQQALMTGADVVKIFPGALVGPKIISEMQGPFPQAKIMPSGGVSLDNLKDWFAAGAFCCGAGGSLVGPGASEDYVQVTKNAKKFHEELLKIKNN